MDSKPEARSPKLLIPIGGGKDSIVTTELLKAAHFDCTLFRMGKHPFIDDLARICGLPLLTVERRLSPTLFELTAQGALNGHVPITAYLSCLTVVLAELYGYDAIAMSAERSASEGNLQYQGQEVNHQWSKSLDFERMFQSYLTQSVATDTSYFSMLRPLSELKIAEIFSRSPQYFEHVTSCNANWKILKDSRLPVRTDVHPDGQTPDSRPMGGNRWCGKCPKCAFAFALFAAFIPKKELVHMFGKDLLEDESLEPLYRELLGIQGNKPFECVGTPMETAAAFSLAHTKGEWEESTIMKTFLRDVLPSMKNPETIVQELRTPSEEHAIPSPFEQALSAL